MHRGLMPGAITGQRGGTFIQYCGALRVLVHMGPAQALMVDQDSRITAALAPEQGRLQAFIKRRVRNPSDAEDILQDVLYEFVRAFRLPEPIEQVGAWLFRVARNRIIDRFRRRETEPLSEPSAESDDDYSLELALPAVTEGVDTTLARAHVLNQLQEALLELPANQREVFVAHEIDGLSFKQIAATTKVPINTLLARKRYAVLHLRQRLQMIYDELDT
jgi:RNA polymerase sigma factor (sigma-70 family)